MDIGRPPLQSYFGDPYSSIPLIYDTHESIFSILRGWIIDSGIVMKFNSPHFDTNMGFQNDAKLRFSHIFKFRVGFLMCRRL